jgi:PAS domain S-box-containing protein
MPEVIVCEGKKKSPDFTKDLRCRAESVLNHEAREFADMSDLSFEDVQKLVHDLEVYKIELEMQNENLRQVQQQVEIARDKYIDLYDFSPVGYLTLSTRGFILEANLTAAQLLGANRARLIKKPFSRFLPRDAADAFYIHLKRLFESQLRSTCELRAVREDGTSLHIQLDGLAFQSGDEPVNEARVVIADITERVKSEQELKMRDSAINTSINGINFARPDGTIFYSNTSFIRMWGFDGFDNAVGTHVSDLWADEEAFVRAFREFQDRGSYSGELQARKRDGNTFDVQLSASTLFDDAGRPLVLMASFIDITERKRSELALRESEELSHAVFESTNDAIYIKDGCLRFQHVNSASCRLMGLPAEEIIGKTAEEIYGEEIGNIISERESRVLEGESVDLEHTITNEDALMILHDAVVPLRNMEDRIIGVYSISRNITDRKRLSGKPLPKNILYPSRAMQVTFRNALHGAGSDSIILLQGESGSGKDFLARWIHDRSNRSAGPFFTVNCAALPLELAESELFGHERGAFTGAQNTKRGLLELAEGGTILLNEIGELSLGIQSKLLAFLDDRSFVRVGGQKHVRVSARLIAASHRDLSEEVAEKRFLKPLYYRLSVFPIRIPPLRERLEDLPTLVEQLIAKLANEMQLKELPIIDYSIIRGLQGYSWPGNVRELRNVLERSLMLWPGGALTINLPDSQEASTKWTHVAKQDSEQGFQDVIDEVAYSLCEHTLRESGGNKRAAAKKLGISRDTLYRYLKKMERRYQN